MFCVEDDIISVCHTVTCSYPCECLGLYSWTCPVLRGMLSRNLTSALSSGNRCYENCFCFACSTDIHTKNDVYFNNTPSILSPKKEDHLIDCNSHLFTLKTASSHSAWSSFHEFRKVNMGLVRNIPLSTVTWGGFLGPKAVEGNNQFVNVVLWLPQIQKYTVNRWIYKETKILLFLSTWKKNLNER